MEAETAAKEDTMANRQGKAQWRTEPGRGRVQVNANTAPNDKSEALNTQERKGASRVLAGLSTDTKGRQAGRVGGGCGGNLAKHPIGPAGTMGYCWKAGNARNSSSYLVARTED